MTDVYLANGRTVPAASVQALDDLAKVWPGATFDKARPAVVAAVLDALHLTDEWTWLVSGTYGYSQGSIFLTYEQARARKGAGAVILHSRRTPWTRVEKTGDS